MKTIIAGGRNIISNSEVFRAILESGFDVSEVVCGCAHGADRIGWKWARLNYKPVHFFPAWEHQEQWAKNATQANEVIEPHCGVLGKMAGFSRNGLMASYADALILIWDGESGGSKDMLKRALDAGIFIFDRQSKP